MRASEQTAGVGLCFHKFVAFCLDERRTDMIRNVLLIQNDVQGATAVLAALTNSRDSTFHVEWVTTCSLGLERLAVRGKQDLLAAGGISAVLVDLILPDAAGMEIVDRIYAAEPRIPIVMLSSSDEESVAKAAMLRGAQDFVMKERIDGYILPKTLAAAIDRAAIAETLFDEQERAQVTLNSIGDAVISTDVNGRVTYLNSVAEKLTGWARADAVGHPSEEVSMRRPGKRFRARWRWRLTKIKPSACRPSAF
jgi:DNA-binding NarL/FixJ family response regulator